MMDRFYKKIKDRVPFDLAKRTKSNESSGLGDDRPKKRSKKKKKREEKKLSDSQINGLFTVDSPITSKNLKPKEDTDSDHEIEKSNQCSTEVPNKISSPVPSSIDKTLLKGLTGEFFFILG